jgi:DNA-binding response OmpR family regulator
MRILVVDDCLQTCDIIGGCVKQKLPNAVVNYAYDGDEALRRIAQDSPSLVVLNIVMEGKTGFDVLARIRADGNTVPVLLTSGYAGEEVRRRGTLSDGRVRFLGKPFKLDDLTNKIGELLRIAQSASPRTEKASRRTRKWTWR